MPQVDEGLIHAWLDGQLSPAESARVEQLVASDTAWQAAAAEARGMIAGASRILGALDDVPSVRSTSNRAVPSVSGVRNAHAWHRAWWLRVAASLVLVAGVAGVAWWKFPGEDSMQIQAPSAEVVAPAVVAGPPVATPMTARAPASAPARALAQEPVASPPKLSVTQPAPASAALAQQRADSRDAVSAKSESRADQARAAIGAAGGAGAAGAPVNAPTTVRPVPVVEQGVMGGGFTATPSQVNVDPRLHGCWVPLDSTPRAADRANEIGDRVEVFVLRFVPPTVTDAVRAGVSGGVSAGGRGGAARSSSRMAPAGASLQNAMSRSVNDSTFVTEWIRNNGTTHLTFTVHGDTLRGMALLEGRGARLPSQPFTALRVTCPQ
jgi:hypothetical protein